MGSCVYPYGVARDWSLVQEGSVRRIEVDGRDGGRV